MAQDPEKHESTESTERIPPGSMPPEDEKDENVSELPEDPDAEDVADKESKDSFPASDPPAW